MGFFEPPPPPPEPEQSQTPEWFGPPDGVLPAAFALEQPLVRAENLAMQLHGGRAYENGFEFTFALLRREGTFDRRRHDPIMRWHEAIGAAELPADLLRFGVEFADGRKATVFDRFRFRVDDGPPPEIVLMQRGGGGAGNAWELRFWVWPLPPPGPVAFVVEWPSEHVALTRVEIDSEPVRDAATRAERLWPENGGSGSGGGIFVRMSS